MDIQWPGNGLDRRIWVWFQLRAKKIFFPPKRTSWLSIAYSPSQLTPWALSPGIKRPERETDHSPSSSAKLTTERCYTSITPYAFKTSYLQIPSPVTTARHGFSGHEILNFIHMSIRTVLIWSFICSKRTNVTCTKSIIQSIGNSLLIGVRIKLSGKKDVWCYFLAYLMTLSQSAGILQDSKVWMN